jgi:hypothetical protein
MPSSPPHRSPKKPHLHHGHRDRDREHGWCRCTVLNILLVATVFVAFNILFSYSYLKASSIESPSPPSASILSPAGKGKGAVGHLLHPPALPVSAPELAAGGGGGGGALPAFSGDDTELFMGAVIERGEGAALHLTTFLLCHYMLGPDVKKAVHASALAAGRINNTMSRLGGVQYKDNGQRSEQPFYICKIRNSKTSTPYVVPGMFLPNRQNFDPNANRRVDVLRCDMRLQGGGAGAGAGAAGLLAAGEAVQVEVFRGRQLLLAFEVPWRARRAGYMLASPPEASRWDAWEGFESPGHHLLGGGGGGGNDSVAHPAGSLRSSHLGKSSNSISSSSGSSSSSSSSSSSISSSSDSVYLCVPGVRRPPSRLSVGPLLEFVEHHTALGVAHIFLGAAFAWGSPHMDALLQLLRAYIDEGVLSVVSEAGDGIDFSSSVLGLRFPRADTKTLFHNMCLYMAKGSARYAAFWDVDEFFVPAANVSIGQAVASAHRLEDGARAGGGQQHPLCYLSVPSREYFPLYPAAGHAAPWVGARFAYEPPPGIGVGRAIVPTKNIFYAGILTAGTCRLEPRHTDCGAGAAGADEFCVNVGTTASLRTHNLDQRMAPEDVLDLPPGSGVLHHYQTYADARLARAIADKSGNRYSTVYFPAVLRGLRRRGLEAMVTLPPADLEALGRPAANVRPGGWKDLSVARAAGGGAATQYMTAEDILGDFFDSAEEGADGAGGGADGAGGGADGGSASSPAVQQLPEFARDFSELFLSALLEREFGSPSLRATLFLMNHAQLLRNAVSGVNVITVNSTMRPVWDAAMQAFSTARYKVTGARDQRFYCKIKLSANASAGEATLGAFMPNRLSPDANANRKLDVVRCPLDVSAAQFERYHNSDEQVQVEVFRDGESLIHFAIPWKTRRTGYMLTSPPGGSGLDVWKGASRQFALHEAKAAAAAGGGGGGGGGGGSSSSSQ